MQKGLMHHGSKRSWRINFGGGESVQYEHHKLSAPKASIGMSASRRRAA
jgi:hypothetical protein